MRTGSYNYDSRYSDGGSSHYDHDFATDGWGGTYGRSRRTASYAGRSPLGYGTGWFFGGSGGGSSGRRRNRDHDRDRDRDRGWGSAGGWAWDWDRPRYDYHSDRNQDRDRDRDRDRERDRERDRLGPLVGDGRNRLHGDFPRGRVLGEVLDSDSDI